MERSGPGGGGRSRAGFHHHRTGNQHLLQQQQQQDQLLLLQQQPQQLQQWFAPPMFPAGPAPPPGYVLPFPAGWQGIPAAQPGILLPPAYAVPTPLMYPAPMWPVSAMPQQAMHLPMQPFLHAPYARPPGPQIAALSPAQAQPPMFATAMRVMQPAAAGMGLPPHTPATVAGHHGPPSRRSSASSGSSAARHSTHSTHSKSSKSVSATTVPASSAHHIHPQPLQNHHHHPFPIAVQQPSAGPQSDADTGTCTGTDNDCDDSASTSSDHISPNFPICQTASSWSSLTVGILQKVMAKLSAYDMAKVMRLVSRHWRAVVDQNLEQLTPKVMKSKLICTRFQNLKALHLTGCANIRNRDLFIISRSSVRLHTLTLGDDTTKPWVTNRGLGFISKISTLTCLNLQDCNSVTNNGLGALQNVRGLVMLSLKGCRKITNAGMDALHPLTGLTHLNLFGVLRISDKGLSPLLHLPLQHLQLGLTRVKDEGCSLLARITTLRSLHFLHEEVSDVGLKALAALAGLTCLVVRDCPEVTGEGLAGLMPRLPNLQALDLFKNWSFNDAQLDKCVSTMSGLTSLDVRATWVTETGLGALTRLTALRRLAMSPQHEHWGNYLQVLPKLVQLTSLSISNLAIVPTQLIEALASLPDLHELDIAEDPGPPELMTQAPREPLRPQTVRALGMLTSLHTLNVSRRPIRGSDLVLLAAELPLLTRLIATGCQVADGVVVGIFHKCPQLCVQRKPLVLAGIDEGGLDR